MNVNQPKISDLPNPGSVIDYGRFLDCVHCGLCTSACPTYVETGDENDSPRGRIYLMRGVADGKIPLTPQVRRHLDLCLDCRACETACPSGVAYGRLLEPFRIAMEDTGEPDGKTADWFFRLVLFGLLPNRDRMRRALVLARWAQRLGLDRALEMFGLFRLLSPRMRQLVTMLPRPLRRSGELPESFPAKGPRRARVALFTGCVGDAVFRETHWATARVLQENGCDVVVPQGQVCCGAIHFHAGQADSARDLADSNVEAFDDPKLDAIIVNVAGCSSMLKDYGHHWSDERKEQRQKLASKVKDVSEFLNQLGLKQPTGRLNLTATFHDACHLAHAQQVSEAPRNLLAQIPGLKLMELPESDLCCGAAGTYNLTEPEMADRLGRRKIDNIVRTGASTVVTTNAGCILQIGREARRQRHRLEVVHLVELLDRSYRGS